MSVPFYPPHLVRLTSYGFGQLGAARYEVMGWVFTFKDGSLRIDAGDGVHVVQLGDEATEELVTIIRALDQGRFHAEWERNPH